MSENSLDNLAQELENLRTILRNAGGCDSPCGMTAILRFCRGLDKTAWEQIAQSEELRDWLAVPLQGDVYPTVQLLQNRLDALARQSENDPLTGLSNRRAFDRTLDMEMERARRNKTPLCLILFDLDNFKKVNDTYGHPCGDKVLTSFAELLMAHKRRYDMAARIGGEEFALILSGVSQVKAQGIVERLLGTLRETTICCKEHTLSITSSAGLSSYKGKVTLSAKELFELTDKALYEAKNTGKDKVVNAPLPDMVVPEPDKTLVHSNEKQFLFSGLK
ncbi:MAG: GGDEF domain-containing protein [Desulfovibrio sp.]|uniref:GGDEF domain-containing protein n=1 Tax=Desulfovibrio sp. 7SRBS1 TaxID=3378064 RepID=UPI003B3F3425